MKLMMPEDLSRYYISHYKMVLASPGKMSL